MTDQRTIEASRRAHLDRYARIEVLIDRLRTIWHLCILNEVSNEYDPVDEKWRDDLTQELEWLQTLYSEALAKEGDVRHVLLPTPPARSTANVTDPNVQ